MVPAPPLNPSGLAERPGTFRGIKKTAAEWQGTARAIGHGPWFWLSTALSPPEPVGREARHLPGYKTEVKANGLRGDLPCAMGPLPASDRIEAKQLRMCLLSKRELRY